MKNKDRIRRKTSRMREVEGKHQIQTQVYLNLCMYVSRYLSLYIFELKIKITLFNYSNM